MRRTSTVILLLLMLVVQQVSSFFVFDQARRALTQGLPRHGQGCFSVQQRPNWQFQKFLKYSACGEFPDVENAAPSLGCNACKTPTVELTCMDGFYFSDGSNSKNITCQCDGWVGIEACEERFCDSPVLYNAAVDPVDGPYKYPVTVAITCTRGFFIMDGNSDYDTQCQADGSWSRTDPCIATTCPETFVTNGKLKAGKLPVLSFPHSILVVCEDGFLTSDAGDSFEAICMDDGMWDLTNECNNDASAACAAVPLLNTVQPEIPRTVHGGTFMVNCDGDEKLPDGSETSYTATCSSGTWDKTFSCGVYTCEDIYAAGLTESAVRTINPDGATPLQVYCENSLEEKGWTVIQRRVDDTTDFFLGWQEYQDGFGVASTNYWLGLDNIRLLTKNKDQKLKVYMHRPNTPLGPAGYASADYGSFYIDDANDKYALHVANFNDGGAGESLFVRHNGQPFTTKDMDNDGHNSNCAILFQGAFWYDHCHYANPNGLFTQTSNANGMTWFSYTTHSKGLTFIEMMIKTA